MKIRVDYSTPSGHMKLVATPLWSVPTIVQPCLNIFSVSSSAEAIRKLYTDAIMISTTNNSTTPVMAFFVP